MFSWGLARSGRPTRRPGRTDRYLVATAYFAHSARHLALAAAEPAEQVDAARYAALADEVADAFRRRYVTSPGRLISDSAALTDTGHLDVAYRLLLQTECPSWLYTVTTGATAIWERWDSLRPTAPSTPAA